MTIYEFLRDQRLTQGKTQLQVAKTINATTSQVISNYEGGRAKLSERMVIKLCKRNRWDLKTARTILINEYRLEINKLIGGKK